MKRFGKAGYVCVRVFEFFYWCAAAFSLVLTVLLAFAPEWLMRLYGVAEQPEGEVLFSQVVSHNYAGGFTMTAAGSMGFDTQLQVIMTAASIVTAALMALVFRRIGQVIRLSGESTPFQKPVVDRVRQVGWLFIAAPLVTVCASLLTYVMCWPSYSFQVDVSGIVTGALVLGLTQIFAYGVKLEDDMEGLL